MPTPHCSLLPLPDHQISFRIAGQERLRWHYGSQYPRPFFYPLRGPVSGESLTRMGHPGAPNHDHHRSIWFAHNAVQGVDFWADGKPSRIRQKEWLAYDDGDTEAVMAVRLGWYDGHDPRELLEQDVFAGVRDGGDGQTLLEIQTAFRPVAPQLEFGKTNFGFLAVRVAKEISAHFGGGILTNSEGAVGEPAIFGKPAAWMDYSGEILKDRPEGITFLDHPTNPGHPSHWHVREDGWMGASACFTGSRVITRSKPLSLRYLIATHAGRLDPARAKTLLAEFAARPAWELVKSPAKHTSWGVRRKVM